MADPGVPLEESLGALEELRAEGKIRHIGVSNHLRDRLDVALEVAPVVSVQNIYNLGRRGADPEIDICTERGIAFMPWAPLFTGSLPPDGPLHEIAAERGATPAQIALAWLLARSPAMLPIPGTSRIDHLEQNVAAAGLRLGEDDAARLDVYSSA
jgi:aryl-alcohol dehydrogenase-like predicted oxidoreductase